MGQTIKLTRPELSRQLNEAAAYGSKCTDEHLIITIIRDTFFITRAIKHEKNKGRVRGIIVSEEEKMLEHS